jgi:hypothetical protein
MDAPLLRHAFGAHRLYPRLDFVVAVCAIGVFATWLLHSLNDAQAEIEKVILDTELNNLRLGISEALVHKSVANIPLNTNALIDSNPMLLIAEKPNNYIGERNQAPQDSRAVWYFDTHKKRLIYVFKDGRQAPYKLTGTAGLANSPRLNMGSLGLALDSNN